MTIEVKDHYSEIFQLISLQEPIFLIAKLKGFEVLVIMLFN